MFRSLRMSSTVHQRSGAADTNRCGLEGHVHSRQSQLPVKSLSAPFLQDMYQRHPATPAVLVRGMFGAASQAWNGKQDKRQCCNMHRWGRWHDALHRQDRQHKQHLLPEQPCQQPSCAVARVAPGPSPGNLGRQIQSQRSRRNIPPVRSAKNTKGHPSVDAITAVFPACDSPAVSICAVGTELRRCIAMACCVWPFHHALRIARHCNSSPL